MFSKHVSKKIYDPTIHVLWITVPSLLSWVVSFKRYLLSLYTLVGNISLKATEYPEFEFKEF